MADDEMKKAKKELERVIADLDTLEREWAALPQAVRDANPDLAQWFDGKPPTKH